MDRNAIEDDKIGLFNPSIEMLGQSAAMHPDKLVFSLLKNGFNEKCFDGKAFFSSEHMIGKSKVSNKGTAKLSLDAYIAARSGMMSLTNSKGEALNLVPNLLVVPPALEKAAMDITEADFINGTRNTMRGTAKPLVVPQLAGSDTAWFLMCTTMPVKPLIYQQRKKVKFVSKTNETDDNVFMSKTFVYGADSRGTRASASGRWPTAATGPPAIDRYELLHTQRGPGHAERGCCESNPHRYRLH
ncbi:MAG: Mu-like prophage major head subunit gpT family protein [Dysosmobacter welbionis]